MLPSTQNADGQAWLPCAVAGYLVETASCLLGRSTEAESMEASVVAWMELMPVLVKASTRDSALLHALFKVGIRTCGHDA